MRPASFFLNQAWGVVNCFKICKSVGTEKAVGYTNMYLLLMEGQPWGLPTLRFTKCNIDADPYEKTPSFSNRQSKSMDNCWKIFIEQ